MPIYEFRCPAGHVTEKLVPMDTDTVVCESCLPRKQFGSVAKQLEHDYDRSLYAGLADKLATRILSATRTNFHFADHHKS